MLCGLQPSAKVWCGGEITTAWKNNITTVPLVCDGFLPLSDEAQKLIPTLWTPQQKQILANYGVEIEEVHAAYAWLQNDLMSIQMPRFGPVHCLAWVLCCCQLSWGTVAIIWMHTTEIW